MKENEFPNAVRTALWSYDTSKLDVVRDKDRIILQTLNNGGEAAVSWLLKTYSKQDLKNVVLHSSKGEWSKKSLNYWSVLLEVAPVRTARFA